MTKLIDQFPEHHTIDHVGDRLVVRRHIERCTLTEEEAVNTLREFVRLVIHYGVQCGMAPHANRKD